MFNIYIYIHIYIYIYASVKFVTNITIKHITKPAFDGNNINNSTFTNRYTYIYILHRMRERREIGERRSGGQGEGRRGENKY